MAATPRTPERPTYGPIVARIAELLGTPLFPAQRYVYDVALEVQSEEAGDPFPGEGAYDEIADFEPRRAGKTFKIGPLVAHKCGSSPNSSAWLTAQKRVSAVRRWDAVRLQLMSPAAPLRRQLKALTGDGHEAVKWRENGSIFLPFAPDSETMHGEEPDLVIVDELWAHDLKAKAQIEQGYKPAWSIKPGQAWLLSAAGTKESAWLNGRREQGLVDVAAGKTLGRATFLWGVPDEVGGVPVAELPDDQLIDVVLDCHPRRDNGLRVPYLADQLADLKRAGFLRAYGNLTDSGAASGVIPAEAWRRAAKAPKIPPHVRVGLGVDVDPDRREAAVVAAWRDPGTGVVLTEILKVGPGTRWVAQYVADVVVRQSPGVVVMNNAGPARDIADDLEHKHHIAPVVDRDGRQEGLLLRIPAGDYAAACARLQDSLNEAIPTVMHRGEVELTKAMQAAAKRRLSGGFAWDRRGEDPITALTAQTLALWAADHMPPEQTRFRIA